MRPCHAATPVVQPAICPDRSNQNGSRRWYWFFWRCSDCCACSRTRQGRAKRYSPRSKCRCATVEIASRLRIATRQIATLACYAWPCMPNTAGYHLSRQALHRRHRFLRPLPSLCRKIPKSLRTPSPEIPERVRRRWSPDLSRIPLSSSQVVVPCPIPVHVC